MSDVGIFEPTMGFPHPTKRAFRHWGWVDDTGLEHETTLDLVFRLATNGVTVTAEVNAEPLITTSAGQFNQ